MYSMHMRLFVVSIRCCQSRFSSEASPSVRPLQSEGCHTSGSSRNPCSASCLSVNRLLPELGVVEEFSTLTYKLITGTHLSDGVSWPILSCRLILSYPDDIHHHGPDERLYLHVSLFVAPTHCTEEAKEPCVPEKRAQAWC